MNARQILVEILKQDDPDIVLSEAESDALRDLDQLLADADMIIKGFTKIRNIQYPEGTHQWILRAAQAGYGEK